MDFLVIEVKRLTQTFYFVFAKLMILIYLIVWIENSHLTNNVFLHHLASCNNVSLCSVSGTQIALHFGDGNFHEISFDDAIVLI